MINESLAQQYADKGAEQFRKNKNYRPYLEALEKSPLSRIRSITEYDLYAVGKSLESFDMYRQMCEEDGNINQLGKIPQIAYDIITASYGASALNVFSSNQPIDEESGHVYFKEIKVDSSRGGLNAGDKVFDPQGFTGNVLDGYAADRVDEVIGAGDGTTTSFSGNIANAPLRTERVTITAGSVVAKDYNGDGILFGPGVEGTINYTTGAFTLDYVTAPAAGDIVATTSQNFEAADDIPRISMALSSKPVHARIWALKDTIGIEQQYAMRRRFGLIAEDEITNDIVAAMNSEITNTGIRMLNANAVGNVNYAMTPPSAVSLHEHRMAFQYTIAAAEANLSSAAGRGVINVMIAGKNGAALLSKQPGFQKVTAGDTVGPHIYGSIDGVTVIRVHNTNILDENTILCLYRGTNPFDAGLVWAPYMPLVVTSALPTGTNPLTNQKAAAVWGGLEVVQKNFVTKITLTA